MRVVIAGAGIAGLTAALALARDGHAVTVVERDATRDARDRRRGVLARGRAGAHRRFDTRTPFSPGCATCSRIGLPTCSSTSWRRARPRSGSPITCPRRSPTTRRVQATTSSSRSRAGARPSSGCCASSVLACDGVTFRDGVDVVGLDVASGTRPRVVGARVRDVHADVGPRDDDPRRSLRRRERSARRARSAGSSPPVSTSPTPRCTRAASSTSRASTGCATGAEMPVGEGPVAGDLGHLKFAVFLGDNRTFSVTLAVGSDDTELRRPLGRPSGFDAAAATLVPAQAWLDGRAEPITGVHLMAGLRNRKRRFVVNGRPIADGFAAVGDASVCTNPLYGRGCSLAVVHAFGLADALREHARRRARRRWSRSTRSPTPSSIRGSAPRCSRTRSRRPCGRRSRRAGRGRRRTTTTSVRSCVR